MLRNKKILTLILIFSIFIIPANVLAISNSQENSNELFNESYSIGHTKPMSITIYIGDGGYPPLHSSTYFYNDGLYSGVLRNPEIERRLGGGNIVKYSWYATYRGYVTSYSGYPTNSKIFDGKGQ